MSVFFAIWQREFCAYFRTAVGWLAAVLFMGIAGLGLWWQAAHLAQMTVQGDLVQHLMGSLAYWMALLLIPPVLTMRLFAEEQRSGTLELLQVAPVTESQVVLAKFAAACSFYFLLWVPTLCFGVLLRWVGANLPVLDAGVVAAAYLGTSLMGSFFVSLGLLCSLLTRHPAVAGAASVALSGVVVGCGQLPFYIHTLPFQRVVEAAAATRHLADFAAGIVDTRTVVGYCSATVLVLFVAIRILEARRLR